MDRSTPVPMTNHLREYNEGLRAERDLRAGSWLNIGSDSEEQEDDASVHLSYLRPSQDDDQLSPNPATATSTFPPSPYSFSAPRPRAPTPSGANDDLWSPPPDHLPSSVSQFSSPASATTPAFFHHPTQSPLLRSESSPGGGEGRDLHTKFSERPLTDSHTLHPFRVPMQPLSSTSLSTASSSSTRSSAYGSSTMGPLSDSGHGHVIEDGHVRVVSGDDDREHHNGGLSNRGITSDDVAQLLTETPSRINAVDPRWSFTSSSSSVGRTNSVVSHDAPSGSRDSGHYDRSWVVEEEAEGEYGISESEATDDDDGFHYDSSHDHSLAEEELTTAVLVAEEGTGQIVQADGIPVNKLNVSPGTTHLLLSSSPTPSLLPPFLTSLLPTICSTLLVLDISANFLLSLPPALVLCTSLEELNVASNPLRVLPAFLCELTSLRVLIADATGLASSPTSGGVPLPQGHSNSFPGLPDSLMELERLHTLSIRRNKLYSLPAWLCKLPALTTLCVDGNPFQGPWKALVDPLLARIPTSPAYPPSTPTYPLASPAETSDGTPTDVDDHDFVEDGPPSSIFPPSVASRDEDDQELTIRAPTLGRSTTSPLPLAPSKSPLQRTRTAPNRKISSSGRSSAADSIQPDSPVPSPVIAEREVRKMKSAGDLRRGMGSMAAAMESADAVVPPPRPQASASTTNLLNMEPPMPITPERPSTRRYASVGANTALAPSPSKGAVPRGNIQSLWENPSEHHPDGAHNRVSFAASTSRPGHSREPSDLVRTRNRSGSKGEKEKTRWGFLKKMSMGKLNGKDSPPQSRHPTPQRGQISPPTSRVTSTTPQIDLRFSMTGTLNGLSSMPSLSISPPPPAQAPPVVQIHKQPSIEALRQQPPPLPPVNTLQPAGTLHASPTSASLLSPTSPVLRPKRRSFLPIDNLSVPDSSTFMRDITVDRDKTPSPIAASMDNRTSAAESELGRREEERMREAYSRALRSVMAYLRDMYDLGVPQIPLPMEEGVRSRRPTLLDREGSTLTVSSDPRSGGATLSVATTDSNGSGEERKFKDDKAKRAMIVKEIVDTERTYVKGLAELVEIYVKPASGPVNILSGVSKETVVPPADRRVVFSGIDSLYSFHKDSFLPALEAVARPLMLPPDKLREVDGDGLVSLRVAKAVGDIFVKHAAFMRMYSTYINNCDNAFLRVKYWNSERQQAAGSPASSSNTASPASSTAQLAGFGLAMSAVSNPNAIAEAATGLPPLSSTQKKRIKSYLKRCKMDPRHSQISLEAYLLLPVQRVPRYLLLLEQLLQNVPPVYEYMDDPLDRAVAEISSLANNMNEGKREAETRLKLVQWQSRIRAKFPSPLVQPHRRLIMDGRLLLTRVVRKAVVSFDTITAQGDKTTVQVDCLAPELTPRPLVGILCNDLLVLCREAADGPTSDGAVDLWAVLRMQTLPQPASIVHGNSLRLVDSKAILYFDAPSASDALTWFRAINLHIPASQS